MHLARSADAVQARGTGARYRCAEKRKLCIQSSHLDLLTSCPISYTLSEHLLWQIVPSSQPTKEAHDCGSSPSLVQIGRPCQVDAVQALSTGNEIMEAHDARKPATLWPAPHC